MEHLTFKIYDPDAVPVWGGYYGGVYLHEEGSVSVTAVIDGVTYEDFGTGTFDLVQYSYGAYDQPYPFDYGIDFAGDTIQISTWSGYNATSGWDCCGSYQYSAPGGIAFTLNGTPYLLQGTMTISAVPVPAGGALLLGALAGLALFRRDAGAGGGGALGGRDHGLRRSPAARGVQAGKV